MTQTDSKQWFCIRAKTKREHMAACLLAARHGIDVFCPRITLMRKTRLGPKNFTEALFPGYLFARIELATEQRKVAAAQNILGPVSFGSHTPAIPDEVIETLRHKFPTNQKLQAPSPILRPGDAVEIIAGSFYGQNATIDSIDPQSDRALLLIDFLGRQVPIQVPRRQLIKNHATREAYPKNLLATQTS